MFDLDPGDDLKLIVETARRLAASELAPKLRDSEAARAIDASTAAAWDEIGLAGLEVPERLGGAELGCLARVLVNEELAAAALGMVAAGESLAALSHLRQALRLRQPAATATALQRGLRDKRRAAGRLRINVAP